MIEQDFRSADILVNNAGVLIGYDSIAEADMAAFEQTIDVNVKAVFQAQP